MSACVSMHIHGHIHGHMHGHVQTDMQACVSTYIYICIYIYKREGERERGGREEGAQYTRGCTPW